MFKIFILKDISQNSYIFIIPFFDNNKELKIYY